MISEKPMSISSVNAHGHVADDVMWLMPKTSSDYHEANMRIS